MAGMFGNKFDVQSALDERLYEEALGVGRLSSYGVGQMAAYQDGMMGSPLEAAISDKFSPEMQKQNVINEIRQKHPNPQTPEELLALANDLIAAGLNDMGTQVQAAAAEMRAAMPKPKVASKNDIANLTGILSLTQGSDSMVDSYLEKLNIEEWAGLGEPERNEARKKVKEQFDQIINGYSAFLNTRSLEPSDIDNMMFTSSGRIKNIGMFKTYLGSLSLDQTGNQFAKHLFDMNVTLLSNGGENKKDNSSSGLKITDVMSQMPNDTTFIEESANAQIENVEVGKNDYASLSTNEKKAISKNSKMDMLTKLNSVYSSMRQFGGGKIGEDNMNASELEQENQDDAIQKWITGGVPILGTAYSEGMKHFLGLPPSRLDEFIANPEAYYRKYILKEKYYAKNSDGIISDQLKKDTSQQVISLWGLN